MSVRWQYCDDILIAEIFRCRIMVSLEGNELEIMWSEVVGVQFMAAPRNLLWGLIKNRTVLVKVSEI